MTTDEIEAAPRQRIAKLMARVGLCSRRDAEAWIVAGRVSLNGAILTSPATDVGPDDTILVDDAPLPAAEKTRLFLFHKPRGLVTSDHDPEGRPTVADHLRAHWPDGPRVVTVGRLDINTEGLLLLTNDGGLARVLELPKTGWMRRYRVRANGETDQGVLDGLHGGITIDGVDYAGIEATLDRTQGANVWLTMGLREGKNREVKRVLEHIGLAVNRLIRLSFGPFQLGELAEGKVEEVRTRVLRDQLGETLARAAGVDFGESAAAVPARRDERPQSRPERQQRNAREAERAPGARRRDDSARPRRDAEAPRGRGDSRRPPREEPTPIRERPARGTRKHVSVLRADEAARGGPRIRTERADVKDRRDRTIAVERRVAARPALEATRARRPRDDARRDAPDKAETRPPRRHASPSAEAKRARAARSGGAGPERPEREARRASRSDGARQEREKPYRSNGNDRNASRRSSRGAPPSPARGRRRPDEVGRSKPGDPAREAGRGGERRADEGSRRPRDASRRSGKAPHPTPLRGATFSRKREKEETAPGPTRGNGKPKPRAGKRSDKPRGKPRPKR